MPLARARAPPPPCHAAGADGDIPDPAGVQRFGPALSRLVLVLLRRMELPDDYDEFDPSERTDFDKFRNEAADCLFDVGEAMGPGATVRGDVGCAAGK